jgi:ATP-dependent DNA helicase RecQ
VRINEKLLANKTFIQVDRVINCLYELHQLEAIRYAPPKRGFTITFMQDRVPAQFFQLSQDTYINRKIVAREKLDSVINYVTRTDKCRSRILLEYFGEIKSGNCGKCDVCIKNVQHKEADDDYVKLLAFLMNFPALEIDIIELYKLQPSVKKHSGTLLKWSIDKGYLTLLPGNKFEIHKQEIAKVL